MPINPITFDAANPSGSLAGFGTPAGGVPSVVEVDAVTGLPADRASETTLAALKGSLDSAAGDDGATPPAIAGTGIRGWLRAIYERLFAGLSINSPVALDNATLNALGKGTVAVSNLPSEQDVTDDGLLGLIQRDMDVMDVQGVPQSLLISPNQVNDPSRSDTMALSVSVRDPITLDQTTPAVIGGVAPDGSIKRAAIGLDGGLRLADGQMAQWFNGIVGPGPLIDTQGYQSIVISFAGASGTYLFQTTNDPAALTASLANAAGWSAGGAAAPVTSAAAAAGANYVIPVTGRYFRLYCSVAGTAGMNTLGLRSAPAQASASTPSFNVAQVAGTAIPAPGTASTNPITAGGADLSGLSRKLLTDANGNLQAVGSLPVGFQVGAYNVRYGGYTQVLYSQTAAQSVVAPVMVGGTDSAGVAHIAATDPFGNFMVRPATSTNADQSLSELLTQIVAIQRVQAHYLYLLVQQGLPSMSSADEPDSLLTDFMSPSPSFSNMTN